ncbi:MAG: hypothetical protein ACI9LY_000470 [Arenicella sp.]|jgi:hypothetical protein
MFEIQVIPALLLFFAGSVAGISVTLLFNKMRTGSASAGKIKQEMEDYQGEVEAHFEETSKKLKDMTAQYQDLYQHLSVGATTLCRSGNVIAGLSNQRDPLALAPIIEPRAKHVDATQMAKTVVDKKSVDIDPPVERSTYSKLNKQTEPSQAKPRKTQARRDQASKSPNKINSSADSLKPKKSV